MTQKIDWKAFWEKVAGYQRFLLTSHVRPDGDSLGSQLAMAEALEKLGKSVLLVNSDPIPPSLTFLDPEKRIRSVAELTDRDRVEMAKVDAHLILDLSSWSQLGKMADFYRDSTAERLVIDHHHRKDEFPGTFFADPDAEATGSLVFDAISASPVEMTASMAFLIWIAIATDTGWFRFQSVKPETFEKGAALMKSGVSPAEAYKRIYEEETLGRIRLIGHALAKTESFLNGRLMFLSLRLTDFDEAGAHPSESEDIVNEALKVGGARMAIIMVEQRSGGFKISFRSRCAVDCSRLAGIFGGGGHTQAAGAFIDRPYEEAKRSLLEATEKEWRACCEE